MIEHARTLRNGLCLLMYQVRERERYIRQMNEINRLGAKIEYGSSIRVWLKRSERVD